MVAMHAVNVLWELFTRLQLREAGRRTFCMVTNDGELRVAILNKQVVGKNVMNE